RAVADQTDRNVGSLGDVHVERSGQVPRRYRHDQMSTSGPRNDISDIRSRRRQIGGDVGGRVDLAVVHVDHDPVALKSFTEYEVERMCLLRRPSVSAWSLR